MATGQRKFLSEAITKWIIKLHEYPGWREWKRSTIAFTLFHDDVIPLGAAPQACFRFSEEIELQHAVVLLYLELEQTIAALSDCEYYFRRYPFCGLPVSRHNHLTHVCEMYFNRFYEFKERLKKYLNALKSASTLPSTAVGEFIKLYDREFDRELRERHQVHHHRRFSDVGIDRILLTDPLLSSRKSVHEERAHREQYRKEAKEWAQRVKPSVIKLERFLEATATITLAHCTFLRETGVDNRSSDEQKLTGTS